MRLLGYPGWLLGFAKWFLSYPGRLLGVDMQLLGYPGWSLRCCYVVARVVRVVARLV